MALSSRPGLALACVAAGLALVAACGTADLLLRYCEDEDGGVISCDCAPAAREVLGGRVGRVRVEESGPGSPGRSYLGGHDLQFVLLGRWLVIEVEALSGSATAMLAWLRCDGHIIPAETVHRSTVIGEWDSDRHEFLALFPASDPDDLATPRCDLHVALVGPYGGGLLQAHEPVYVAHRTTRRPDAIAGEAWNVAIREDPAPSAASVRARLEPAPPPAEPRLCRGP